LRDWLCDPERVWGRAGATQPPGAGGRLGPVAFAAAVERAKTDLRGLVPKFCDQLREILGLRQTLLVQPHPHAGLERDLAALLPPDFLRTTPYTQLPHFPRYLKAMRLRAERWRQNPAKDAERAAQLAPYEKALRAATGGGLAAPRSAAKPGERSRPAFTRATVEAFRWLVEEFRVSLFAQELGTAEPVSTVKLDRALAALQGGATAPSATAATAAAAPAGPRPILAAPVSEKKSGPLKNLGALDKLFPR